MQNRQNPLKPLLEQENEALTAENQTLNNQRSALTDQNQMLSAEVENLTADNAKITGQKEVLKAANEVLKADNGTLKSDLNSIKRKALDYKRDAENHKNLAKIGKDAIVDKRAEYIEVYEGYHDTDDAPMTEKEKLHLSESVQEMDYDALIDGIKNLKKEAHRHGWRKTEKSRSEPKGHTRQAV